MSDNTRWARIVIRAELTTGTNCDTIGANSILRNQCSHTWCDCSCSGCHRGCNCGFRRGRQGGIEGRTESWR